MDEETKNENGENTPNDGENKPTTEESEGGSESGYAEAIEELRAEYQAKFEKQEAENKARLAERDKVIKQLLTGNGKTATVPEDKIVDSINKKRIYKKW